MNRFALFATVILCAPLGNVVAALPHFDVKKFGAIGDGAHDDTVAIQNAIDAAGAAGAGVVEIPAGTYLLNTNFPAAQSNYFYNLKLGSKIILQGTNDAKLLQGPGGRHLLPSGASEVHNTVLAVGSNYSQPGFHDVQFNGGFFELFPTTESNSVVKLVNPASVTNFAPGDFVAIYNSTNEGSLLGEIQRVQMVSALASQIHLRDALVRSFPKPVMARVTPLMTQSVSIGDLTIEGTEPLAVTEAADFLADRVQFVIDTAPGGGNAIGIQLKSLRDFRFISDTFQFDGLHFDGFSVANLELMQSGNQQGWFTDNSITASSVVFGEDSVNVAFYKNRFEIKPAANVTNGIIIGGKNIEFASNDIRGGNLFAGAGKGALFADYNYATLTNGTADIGRLRLVKNGFHAELEGNACVAIRGSDTTMIGNTIFVTGSGIGIRMESPLTQSNRIQSNFISTETGDGMVIINGKGAEKSFVIKNAINGTGTNGILVDAHRMPNYGGVTIVSNTFAGFTNDVSAK